MENKIEPIPKQDMYTRYLEHVLNRGRTIKAQNPELSLSAKNRFSILSVEELLTELANTIEQALGLRRKLFRSSSESTYSKDIVQEEYKESELNVLTITEYLCTDLDTKEIAFLLALKQAREPVKA